MGFRLKRYGPVRTIVAVGRLPGTGVPAARKVRTAERKSATATRMRTMPTDVPRKGGTRCTGHRASLYAPSTAPLSRSSSCFLVCPTSNEPRAAGTESHKIAGATAPFGGQAAGRRLRIVRVTDGRPASTSQAANAAAFCSARQGPATSRPSAVNVSRSDWSLCFKMLAASP